jgi:hypothetical protein
MSGKERVSRTRVQNERHGSTVQVCRSSGKKLKRIPRHLQSDG